jgi:hypothetical protein
MEQLLKDYEERFNKSHKELRDTKELQGTLLDAVQNYERQSQEMATQYQAIVQHLLTLPSPSFPT